MVRVRIPATSANLGPGFDCLGLALTLYNYVVLEESHSFQINLAGTFASGLPCDKSNLIWQSMCALWNEIDFPLPKVTLHFENHIPPARGLGSSSAAIIGGLVAANEFAGGVLTKQELLRLANQLEGHPDNVTPALLGGITLAVETKEKVIARTLLAKPDFKVLAIVPDFLLTTDKSRSVLPPTVSREDAVYNLSRTALLVESIIHQDYELLKEGMQDRLHQNQRANLVPGLPETLKTALTTGAYGSALSGSGPTVLALVPAEKAATISQAMLDSLSSHGLSAEAFELSVDSEGATIL